jgi:hypothetical protein
MVWGVRPNSNGQFGSLPSFSSVSDEFVQNDRQFGLVVGLLAHHSLFTKLQQDDNGACQEMDGRPSLPVAELRGHGDGPIHIVHCPSSLYRKSHPNASTQFLNSSCANSPTLDSNRTPHELPHRPSILLDRTFGQNKKADGKYCITGANDGTMRLWNPTHADPACGRDCNRDIQSSSSWGCLPSALPMQTYADGHMHPVHSIATNRSSTVLLSASDRTLLAMDLITTQAIRAFGRHRPRRRRQR